jgi:hypothetical protein
VTFQCFLFVAWTITGIRPQRFRRALCLRVFPSVARANTARSRFSSALAPRGRRDDAAVQRTNASIKTNETGTVQLSSRPSPRSRRRPSTVTSHGGRRNRSQFIGAGARTQQQAGPTRAEHRSSSSVWSFARGRGCVTSTNRRTEAGHFVGSCRHRIDDDIGRTAADLRRDDHLSSEQRTALHSLVLRSPPTASPTAASSEK